MIGPRFGIRQPQNSACWPLYLPGSPSWPSRILAQGNGSIPALVTSPWSYILLTMLFFSHTFSYSSFKDIILYQFSSYFSGCSFSLCLFYCLISNTGFSEILLHPFFSSLFIILSLYCLNSWHRIAFLILLIQMAFPIAWTRSTLSATYSHKALYFSWNASRVSTEKCLCVFPLICSTGTLSQ